jgi:carbon monoxide dehydrogenase subunit G
MVAYSTDTFIDRPPEQVFPYITDPGQHAAWMDVAEARALDGQPAKVGSRVAAVVAWGPIRLNTEWEVSELEPDRRYGFRTTRGPMDWAGAFTIEPEGTGSRVASSGAVEFRGFLRLLQPLMAGEVRSGEARELRRLKALVEGGGVPSA